MELQQRAVEYMSLERRPELARSNVVAMPPWEKRKSLLLRRMAAREVIASNFPTLTLERAPGRSAGRCCCAAWLTVRCLLHTPSPDPRNLAPGRSADCCCCAARLRVRCAPPLFRGSVRGVSPRA